jgi:MSHA biogenesis protein MshI
VIDVRETAQRNVQSALAASRGRLARANAALAVHDGQCLLTVCAHGELFYTRRLDWNPQSLLRDASPSAPAELDANLDAGGFAELDIVDYGAESDDPAANDETPRLVIEVQRSIDLWERSWPELPLELIVVQADGHSRALAAQIERALAIPIEVLDEEPLFPGFTAAAPTAEVRSAVRPLLGALLRREARQL